MEDPSRHATVTALLKAGAPGADMTITGELRLHEPVRQRGPTIESVHRDIQLANTYRMELIKYLLAITAGLFAFTVTFRPTLSPVQHAWAMWLGWTGLGLSMIGGLFHMVCWDHYYKSYRDFDWKHRLDTGAESGRQARKQINWWREAAMVVQYGGFMIGVIGIAIFAGVNIDNVRKAEAPAPASAQPASPPAPAAPAPPSKGARK
jgi:hypothetical protein